MQAPGETDTPRSSEDAIIWQAEHCRQNDAPVTARIVSAMLHLLETDTLCGRRMADWHGLTAEAATPLRLAAAFHHLRLSGGDLRLEPVYAGKVFDQGEVDDIVLAVTREHDTNLVKWFDSPPQTNEAGRSAGLMAGLLWLAERLGPGCSPEPATSFDLLELGASAGVNTMMERFSFDLGGTRTGPPDSTVSIRPKWSGPPPPAVAIEIRSIQGCDRAPIDLTDPAQALRLKSYCWPENSERHERLDAVVAMARSRLPLVARSEAADWAERRLAESWETGVVRVLFHSIVWQYLDPASRTRIETAMEAAGKHASPQRPLAWLSLETNRKTYRHELRARYWPGGEQWVTLGHAHAHGAWVEWFGG